MITQAGDENLPLGYRRIKIIGLSIISYIIGLEVNIMMRLLCWMLSIRRVPVRVNGEIAYYIYLPKH